MLINLKKLFQSEPKDESQQIINGQVSDEEALNMMANAGKIQNSNVEFELEQPNGNNKSEENAKAIENGQVSDEEALNMMADAGKNQSSEVAVEVESENKGRQLVSKISEAPQKIKEKLTANNNKAIKVIAVIAAAGAVVFTAGAALGLAPAAIATAGVAGYGVSQFNKGKKL